MTTITEQLKKITDAGNTLYYAAKKYGLKNFSAILANVPHDSVADIQEAFNFLHSEGSVVGDLLEEKAIDLNLVVLTADQVQELFPQGINQPPVEHITDVINALLLKVDQTEQVTIDQPEFSEIFQKIVKDGELQKMREEVIRRELLQGVKTEKHEQLATLAMMLCTFVEAEYISLNQSQQIMARAARDPETVIRIVKTFVDALLYASSLKKGDISSIILSIYSKSKP